MATQTEKDQAISDWTAAQNAAQFGLDHANALTVADDSALREQIASLSAQLATAIELADAAVAERDQLQAKIAVARARAQADKDADAANVAGQGVLDALA